MASVKDIKNLAEVAARLMNTAEEVDGNFALGLAIFRALVETCTKEAEPMNWALIQLLKGTAWCGRAVGDRRDNLERAIGSYNSSLEVVTRLGMPLLWAMVKFSLGNAWSDRIAGDKKENLEQAIRCFNESLEVFTRSGIPVDWAKVKTNLGNIWRVRIAGDKKDNLEQAMHCFNESLEVFTRSGMPVDWAKVKSNLGSVWSDRIAGDKKENLEQAIRCFNESLEVYTRSGMPVEWATVKTNLGSAWSIRIAGNKKENLEQAIYCYNESLEVFTKSGMPVEWATVKMNLGIAWIDRIAGDKKENLEQAIYCFNESLEVRARSGIPVDWATVKMNLGIAWGSRIAGDKKENLEQAIYCFNECLEVFTRSGMPMDWASVKTNLGIAWSIRIVGNKKENLEQAIHCYNESLKVFTRSGMPVDWAKVKLNLGNAWSGRKAGNRKENLEHAMSCYSESLEVFTRSRMPVDWAGVKMGLGNAWGNRIAGDKKENLEQAIYCFNECLEAFTRSGMPMDWARVKANLGIAWRNRIAGNKKENLEQAILHLENACSVVDEGADPLTHLKILEVFGRALIALGSYADAEEKLADAVACLKHLIALVDTGIIHLRALWEEFSSVYEDLMLLCVEKGSIFDALQVCEEGKAQVLRGLLAEQIEITVHLSGEEKERYLTSLDKLRGLMHEVDKAPLDRRRNTLLASIRDTKQEVERYVNMASGEESFLKRLTPPNLKDVCDELDDRTVVIEWFFCRGEGLGLRHTGVVAFLIWKGTVQLKSCAELGSIEHFDDLQLFGMRYEDPDDKNWLDGMARMRKYMGDLKIFLEEVFRMIPESLVAGRQLLIVPHRALHIIPLHILEIENEGVSKQLGDWFPDGVYVLPSLSIGLHLSRNKKTSFAPSELLIAEREVVSVTDEQLLMAPAFKRLVASTPIKRQRSFSLAEVSNGLSSQEPFIRSCDVLCTYSHGVVANVETAVYDKTRAIEECGLSYIDEHGERKVWSMDKIWRLKFEKCSLVCIVACRGGAVNSLSASDECFGIGTAFLVAGARHVVCSLWPVREEAAILVMKRFFQNLSGDDANRSRSTHTISGCLLEAQNWYRRLSREAQGVELKNVGINILESQLAKLPDNSDFYHWGSFIVLGPGE